MISSTQPMYSKWVVLKFLSLELIRHDWEKVATTLLSYVFKFTSALRTQIWFPYTYIERYDLPSRDGGLMRALTSSITPTPLLMSSCTAVGNHLVNGSCSIPLGYSGCLPGLCRQTSFWALSHAFISSACRLLPNTQSICCLCYVQSQVKRQCNSLRGIDVGCFSPIVLKVH
jgi:hypothetical protein